MKSAPIVLFVYNRPRLLKQTLDALAANEGAAESTLFVYADGPKPNADEEQLKRIREVREMVMEEKRFGKVVVRTSEENKGLADSVIRGVTEVTNEFGRTIVIEDDVITSRYFLRFMNDALTKYENEERVLSVGSWNYFFKPQTENFFMNMPDCIAWATWKRAWDKFEHDSKFLIHELERANRVKEFNLKGRFNFMAMLQASAEAKVSSWAIRWTAVAALRNSLTIYPSVSMTKHIGYGFDSSNSEGRDFHPNLVVADRPIRLEDIPLVESKKAVDRWVYEECVVKKNGLRIDNSFVMRTKRLILKLIGRA
jgi:glycosyltransferase involved in cell wall biosynthesis